jgi:hypothetical protein
MVFIVVTMELALKELGKKENEEVGRPTFFKSRPPTYILGPGTLMLPNGDMIEGEWNDNEILKAKYIKGKMNEIPR